jgi:DNA (cytosine-5)-methyltransferase 1
MHGIREGLLLSDADPVETTSSRSEVIAGKRERLASGAAPRILDLFSGCGGLSLGFQRAGFEILGGVEKESRAARAYSENLHRSESEERRKLLGKSRDIRELAPTQMLADLGFQAPERLVDILVGGPPCQAYARVGRAKLRATANQPDAFLQDDRGNLYLQYLEYVRQLLPLALVMENVPDLLSYGERNLVLEIAGHLREIGYRVNFGLLNAANYGVPQTRRRIYIIALHEMLDRDPSFPAPTHRIRNLPNGYKEFAALAARLRQGDTPFSGPAPASGNPHEILPWAVTVQQAFGDLPPLSMLNATLRGRSRFSEKLTYAGPPLSSFAREMRCNWPGFAAASVQDHVTRQLPRDLPIFARMKPGDDYPAAHRTALELFSEEVARQRAAGVILVEGSKAWEALKKTIVPPYDSEKFPNKWWKMDPESPARTLLAHLAHDGYTHIHPHEARTISVREAARLQSFPDGFRFSEAMNPSFRMIGNAVPPVMAWRLAKHLLAELQQACRTPAAIALAS